MDVLVVPTVVVDAYRARPGLSAPRHNWSDECIKTVTDWARQHGIAGGCQRGDQREHKWGYHTVYGWLEYFQNKIGDSQKRGRKMILSLAKCAELQNAVTKLEAEPSCQALTANSVASALLPVVQWFGHRYLSFGHRYLSFGHRYLSFGQRHLSLGHGYHCESGTFSFWSRMGAPLSWGQSGAAITYPPPLV